MLSFRPLAASFAGWVTLFAASALLQAQNLPTPVDRPVQGDDITSPPADVSVRSTGGWLRMRLHDAPADAQLPVTIRYDRDSICRATIPRIDQISWRPDCGSAATHHDIAVDATTLTASNIAEFAARTGIVRVELASRPGTLRALDVTTRSVGSTAVRRRPSIRASGSGVTIGVIDSPVDVLHPALFRADGGAFRWIDGNGDGRLTGGSGDGVDLDSDGSVDRNERLRVLHAEDVVDYWESDVRRREPGFQPEFDWLYLDQNEDGVRNAGLDAGFGESTPAYGEPIFVADDVDDDGVITRHEKIFRLDTSKIKTLHREDDVYKRGANLIAAARELPPDTVHGTGTVGILVAGQPRYHRRAGLAPNADILAYAPPFGLDGRTMRHIDALQDATESGTDDNRPRADVFLHQWVNPFTQPLNGRTNLDVALDNASASGMPQVVPVGNLQDARKHTSVESPTPETRVGFDIPERVELPSSQREVIDRILGSFQYDGAVTAVRLIAPNGQTHKLPLDGSAKTWTVSENELTLQGAADSTGPSSSHFTFDIQAAAEYRLPAGNWAFTLEFTEVPAKLWGRITDPYSRWDPGVVWREPTTSSTVAHPAAAREAVGVGAHRGRYVDASGPGTPLPEEYALRDYSGRGPSFDGRRVVDIVAPDNPFVPLAAIPEVDDRGWGRGWWLTFGGTSGAAPHVAGALAQLSSADRSIQLPDTLISNATTTGLVGPTPDSLPNDAWGQGALDALAATGMPTPPENNRPPVAGAQIRSTSSSTLKLTVDGSSDPDGDDITIRVDTDYDGTWEGRPGVEETIELTPNDVGRAVKVRVRDEWGATDATLALVPTESAPDGGHSKPDTERRPPADEKPPCGCSGPGPALPGSTFMFAVLFGTWIRLRRRLNRFENFSVEAIICE